MKKLPSDQMDAMTNKLEENGATTGGNQLFCFLEKNSPSVEPAAKVNLEENGFVVFTEFLDAVELEEVEQNLAR